MSDTIKFGPTELSRRSMLRSLALSAGGAVAFGTTLTGTRVAEAQTKVAQTAVGYQDTPHGTQQCDNCMQFQPPSSCKVVAGAIKPSGWCKVYVKKPA